MSDLPDHADFESLSARLLAGSVSDESPLASSPLPTQDELIRTACGLRNLLCPGIRPPLDSGARIRAVREQLRQTRRQLIHLVKTVLEHTRSGDIRIHDDHRCSLQERSEQIAGRFLQYLPQLQTLLRSDVQAAFDGDPAATSTDEIVACYPGVQAVLIYRIAHTLLELGVPCLPRMLSEWAHRETGIDIHPGARIGPSFFIDHGTGVVVGETCIIGTGVTLYQGVTLGAWSFPRDEDGRLIRGTRRHPTLEDNVIVYSNASILGGSTVVGTGSQIGSGVTLSRSVPPNTIVTIEKPSLQFRNAG